MVFRLFIATFFFISVSQSTDEKIILPDSRLFYVPKQESYSYVLKDNSPSSLERLYVLSKEHIEIALLCPKGYSIFEMAQELVMNSSFNISFPETIRIHYTASLLKREKFGNRMPPCPTLYHCLGYQACLFTFSYKFCYNFSHSTVLLTIVCSRDDLGLTPKKFQKHKDRVLYMHNDSQVYESEFSSEQEILHTVLSEHDVFSGKCSSPKIATEIEGFHGSCSKQPPTDLASQQLWSHFTRTSENCRNHLQQVYCALQYNEEGLCLPPIYHNQNKKSDRIFSFQALPEIGLRPRIDRYKEFLSKQDSLLIPARLAFVILVNNETEAVMTLIHAIYRKQFLYMIHINKRSTTVRKKLTRMIAESDYHNVFILPLKRSFSTFPSSYETIRAQLEGFEELLRLGVWDFVINLSEDDICIRNIDDLAFALAPHRGLSFVSSLKIKAIKGKNGISSDLVTNAFFACDGCIHNLTSKSPFMKELQMFYASHRGTYNRQFIHYLINEKLRSSVINRFQFYLQTDASPEETYIPTIFMNSPFKDSMNIASIHASLVIHRDVWDSHSSISDRFPEVKDSNAISKLLSVSHKSFFLQKNLIQLPDNALKFAQELTLKEYYKFIEKYLPPVIIQMLVEKALANLSSVAAFPTANLVLQTVLNVCVAPSLVPHDICCRSSLIKTYQEFTDFNYWIDASLFNKISGNNEIVRIMLQPSFYNARCYGDGDLRMASVLPWKSYEDWSDPIEWLWFGSKHSLPFPYAHSNIEGVSARLLLAKNTENLNCMSYDDLESEPFTFNEKKFVKVELRLIAPNQNVRCTANNILTWDTNSTVSLDHKTRLYEQIIDFPCKNMEPGPWTLQIRKSESSKSRIYSFPFYLVDLQNADILQKHLKNISLLFTIKSFAVITNNYSFNFQEEKYEEEYLSLTNQYQSSSQIDKSGFKYHKNFYLKKKSKITHQFICSGGFGSSILLILAVIWIYSWRSQFIQNIVFFSIFSMFLGVLLQIILFMIICD